MRVVVVVVSAFEELLVSVGVPEERLLFMGWVAVRAASFMAIEVMGSILRVGGKR